MNFFPQQVLSYNVDDSLLHASIKFDKNHVGRKTKYSVPNPYQKIVSIPQAQYLSPNRHALKTHADRVTKLVSHHQSLPGKLTSILGTHGTRVIKTHPALVNAGYPLPQIHPPQVVPSNYPTQQPLHQNAQYVSTVSPVLYTTPRPAYNTPVMITNHPHNYPTPLSPNPITQYYPTPQPMLASYTPSPHPQYHHNPSPAPFRSTISPHHPDVTAVYRSTTGITPRPTKPTIQPSFYPTHVPPKKSLRFEDPPITRYRSTIGPYRPVQPSIELEKE